MIDEPTEPTETPSGTTTGTRRGPLHLVDGASEVHRRRAWLRELSERSDGGAEGFPPVHDLADLAGTWFDNLTWTKHQKRGEDPTYVPASNVSNAIAALVHDGRWRNVLAYDEFAECITTSRMPPWHPNDSGGATVGDWTEEDTTRTESWLLHAFGIRISDAKVMSAVAVASRARTVHPVRTYLRGLEWDGIERIDRWGTYLLGVAETPYVKAVCRAWLVSAVARVMRPGCKVDTMLVLEGKTGIKKSVALRALAGDPWFTEIASEIDPTATPQLLRRKWIVELGELAALRRTREQETIKSFLSRQEDNYRPPYGKRARDFPRQSVFAGSTNEDRYLRDPTGARRFWPIKCTVINLRGIEIERDQLWAEAVQAYDKGEAWHLTDEELVKLAVKEQSDRYEDDAWTEPVRAWCESRHKVGVTTEDVLEVCLQIEVGKWTHGDISRVGAILRRMQWAPAGNKRPRKYFPEES